MDWNGSNRHFVSRPENSFGFLYNNYNYDNYPSDVEMKQHPLIGQTQEGVISAAIMEKNNYAYQMERKKRLTSDQLDSLETSFQEEIKLDPDRKMKLAQELGLQPRQIAVWFQNRRARWKNKQLERLYEKLQKDFAVVSKEKQKLQQEVLALRTIVKEQTTMKKQPTTGYGSDISREEMVESTSANNNPPPSRTVLTNHDYVFNVNGCNPVMVPPPYWGVMPPSNY